LVDTPLLIKYGGHPDQLSKKYWGMDRFRLESLAKLLRDHTVQGFLRADDYQASLHTFNAKLSIYCQGALKRSRHEHVAELKNRYDDILSLTV